MKKIPKYIYVKIIKTNIKYWYRDKLGQTIKVMNLISYGWHDKKEPHFQMEEGCYGIAVKHCKVLKRK